VRLIAVPARPPLSRFVELFWFVTGHPDHNAERVLPNGVTELIFNLHTSPHRVIDRDEPSRYTSYHESWVAGLQEQHIVIGTVVEFDLVGVRFRPGGAAPFLRCSPAEVTNQVLECRELGAAFGDLAARARERLLAAGSVPARVAVLEELLLARLDRDWAPDPAVDLALRRLRRPAASPIAELARAASLSHKGLIGRFRREVGTSPKLLQQINRFQHALRLANAALGPLDWAVVARRAGYFDQPHLIRAFHRFGGTTPMAYMRQKDADENHIVLEGEIRAIPRHELRAN
jgi:AraC-like DNA-binding protein